MRLMGKSAIITGASRGIGRAIALRFAEQGCDVVINYVADPSRDNAAEATAVAEEIGALGATAICVEASVTDPEAVAAMVAEAREHFLKVDILVNNAGITRDRTLKKMTREDWDAVLAVNLTGAFTCTKAALDQMLEREYGRIISLSSVTAQGGTFGQANYAASKAGLIGFTKTLALEVARKGITVNCLAPGFTQTEMTAAMPEEVQAATIARIPMGRMAQPLDIANAALFLASDEAAYITGQVLAVNGGMYM